MLVVSRGGARAALVFGSLGGARAALVFGSLGGARAALVLGMLAAGAAGCGKGIPGSDIHSCTLVTDCPSGQICVNGICGPPGSAPVGSGCSATRDCGSGLYCDGAMAKCAPGGTLDAGAACSSDGACKPPLVCRLDGFFGSCATAGTTDMGGSCQSTADCLAGLACGPTTNKCTTPSTAFPPFAGATCTDEGPFRAYFEVPRPGRPPKDFFRLPFPNDIRVTAGALDISDFPKPGPTPLGVDLVQLYVDTWTADFDGFGANGGITFRFSGDIDYATATPEAVGLVDLATGFALSRSWVTNNGRTKYSCNHTVVLHGITDEPLAPNRAYAAFVTTGVRSNQHETPVADPDLTAVLGSTRPDDAALGHAWDAYAPLRDWLGKQTPPIDVAAATVFTVADAPGHMQRLAANLATQPAPALTALTLCGSGAPSPCDDGTSARDCPAAVDAAFDEIHGRFSIPIYQTGTEPYDKPADGGGIAEVGGIPAPARTEDVCFALTIPKGPAMPAAGWPLVVYHHGTGGSMRSFISDGIAAQMGAAPAGAAAGSFRPSAVFGFDAVEHGARKGTSTKSSNDLVFNPLNPHAARDNFLQGAVDILQALRLPAVGIAAGPSPTGAAIAFDPAAVTYYGHSQGSTSGELAIACSAAAPAAVFSGAGAYLTRSLLDKTMPVNIGAGLAYLLGEPLDAEHPVMTLFQSYFERSDPLNYNPLIVRRPPAGLRSKHVYMSWGTGDTYTPKSTLDANARSLGVPPVAPLIEGLDMVTPVARPVSANVTDAGGATRTAAVFQYRSQGYDGHFVASQNPAAVADWLAFLQSYLTTGTPTVP